MLVASHHLTCTQVPISADRLWCNCLYHWPDIRRQDKGMLRVRAYGCCYWLLTLALELSSYFPDTFWYYCFPAHRGRQSSPKKCEDE